MSMGLCCRPSRRVNRWVMWARTKLERNPVPEFNESSSRENGAEIVIPFVRERLQQPRPQRPKTLPSRRNQRKYEEQKTEVNSIVCSTNAARGSNSDRRAGGTAPMPTLSHRDGRLEEPHVDYME